MTANHYQQQQDVSSISMSLSQHNEACSFNKRSSGPATPPPPSSQKKTCHRKRKVSFSPTVRCRKTLSLVKYTSQEIEAAWYSPSDFQSMRVEVRETVNRMESNKTIDDIKYCRRGIESHTKYGAQIRQENRQKALWAVLQEQDMCDAETTDDELASRIARSYAVAGALTRRISHIVGLADEQIVNEEEATGSPSSAAKRTGSALRRAFSLAA